MFKIVLLEPLRRPAAAKQGKPKKKPATWRCLNLSQLFIPWDATLHVEERPIS
jgi:hypothetical protein